MSKPEFVVPIADLEWGPKSVTWPIHEAWLRHTLEGTDATPRGVPGSVSVELTKQGRDVIVRGGAEVHVFMPCVVTLDPVEIDLKPEIFLMLSPAEPSSSASDGKKHRKGAGHGPGERQKSAKADKNWKEDPELSESEAARDSYEGTQVVLDSFVREFILLELPMYPRRSDLPPDAALATAPPSAESSEKEPPVDPRLLPLAAIASRLREKKE